MIVSITREEDKRTAECVLSILEASTRSFQRTHDANLIPHIERLYEWFLTLTEKIKTYDYMEDDKRRLRVDTWIWESRQAAQAMLNSPAGTTTENMPSQRGEWTTELPKSYSSTVNTEDTNFGLLEKI